MQIKHWLTLGAGGVGALAVLFAGWVYAASEIHYRAVSTRPFDQPVSTDAATLARGEHIAWTRGCRGCHGAALEGEIMWGGTETPNLAAYAREHGVDVFEAALRQGIGHEGRALYSMPSYNFVRLTDADVTALYAYLRSAPLSDAEPQGERVPWLDRAIADFTLRFTIARGEDGAMPKYLPLVPPLTQQDNPDPRIARGEYLAMTSCNECHGFDLRAHAPWPTEAPDLIVIGAYSEAEFARLMRDGVPTSGAELPMMGPVARGRFSHWTDEEVADLYAYLTHMSQSAIEAESR